MMIKWDLDGLSYPFYVVQRTKETSCDTPSPLLVDIVLFGLSLSGFPSKFLKPI